MDDLIRKIEDLLVSIEQKADVQASLEWYLRNNLLDYRGVLQSQPSRQQLENATRALVRFCTESMDWGDPLYRQCTAITSEGAHLAKQL